MIWVTKPISLSHGWKGGTRVVTGSLESGLPRVGCGLRAAGADIAEAFAQYYGDIYQTQTGRGEEDCNEFLKDIVLPTLNVEER